MTKISLLIAALCVFTTTAYAGNTDDGTKLFGEHYNLNLIGVAKGKTADMTGNNGHRIFVWLNGGTKIMLAPAPVDDNVFEVLDANGTDGEAKFQLPIPGDNWCEAVDIIDPNTGAVIGTDIVCPTSVTVDYQIWARALGKPNGTATMRTCIEDPDLAGGFICSDDDYAVTLTRKAGPSKFTNVTKQLLFVSADVDGDGVLEHVQIFDPLFDEYYWQYDNTGLKLAQLRFYPWEMSWTW